MDVITLIIASGTVAVVLALALGAINLAEPRYRGVRTWALSNLTAGISFYLVSRRGIWPPHYSILWGNGLGVLTFCLWCVGLRRFLGRPVNPWPYLIALLAVPGALAYYLYVAPSFPLRVAVLSLAYAAFYLCLGRTMQSERDIGRRLHRCFFSITVWGLAAFFLVRSGYALTHMSDVDLGSSAFVGIVSVVVFMLSLVCVNITMIMFITGRQGQELEVKVAELQHEIEQRRGLEEKLSQQAFMDHLTEAANRRGLEELAGKSFALARGAGEQLALIMLDIDHFKAINDSHGHQLGDVVLQELAKCCRAHLRQGDILARYGGEEFVIMLPRTDADQAAKLAERLRLVVERCRLPTQGQSLAYTISLGVSGLRPDDQGPQDILARADAAMYQAKERGRNLVRQA